MSWATSTARRIAAATWIMSSTTVASRAYAVVPARRSRWSRGGAYRPRSAPAAGSASSGRPSSAPRAAQTHNLHRAASAWHRSRRAEHSGVLGRTGGLSRAALVVMSLQELACQLLAPPVHPARSAGLRWTLPVREIDDVDSALRPSPLRALPEGSAPEGDPTVFGELGWPPEFGCRCRLPNLLSLNVRLPTLIVPLLLPLLVHRPRLPAPASPPVGRLAIAPTVSSRWSPTTRRT